ncbi:uncharacterized protein LOC135832930 [Planococcus citri]|uniref:uncharacterized protein LOC135832930 n=1 Tax=Planococcus citri TaxID=170843 RepID=UPI0031F95A1B
MEDENIRFELLGRIHTLNELLLAERQRSFKYVQEIASLQFQQKQRDDVLLIMKVQARIEELEEMFLPHQYRKRNQNRERRMKWTLILTCPDPPYSTNVELISFRASVAHIDQNIFIDTVCGLYPDFSPTARQRIWFALNYDDNSIYRMLAIDAGFSSVLDVRRVQVVHGILAPILLPPPAAPVVLP